MYVLSNRAHTDVIPRTWVFSSNLVLHTYTNKQTCLYVYTHKAYLYIK